MANSRANVVKAPAVGLLEDCRHRILAVLAGWPASWQAGWLLGWLARKLAGLVEQLWSLLKDCRHRIPAVLAGWRLLEPEGLSGCGGLWQPVPPDWMP